MDLHICTEVGCAGSPDESTSEMDEGERISDESTYKTVHIFWWKMFGKGDMGGFATDGDIDGRGESRRTNRQGEEVQENKVVVFFLSETTSKMLHLITLSDVKWFLLLKVLSLCSHRLW